MTHIPRKMCHIFGVSTDIVTHIPRKMCHVFGVSAAHVWTLGLGFRVFALIAPLVVPI